jgi:signal peptidase I
MENTIIKKEVPRFAVADFKNFAALCLKLKNNPENPIFKNISEQSRVFITVFDAKTEIDKKNKKTICADFNVLIVNYGLYSALREFYGTNKLDAALSAEVKAYRNDLEYLNAALGDLTRTQKNGIEWLNLYLLSDLFSDAIITIRKKGVVRAWLEALVIAGALVIFLRTFFFQIYRIPTTSMVPTLMPGDQIFVSRLTYGPKIPFTKLRLPGFRKPQRGDIVVFVPPHERNKFYIKRLIGLPQEHILIKGGNIYVNGKRIVEPHIAANQYYNEGPYGMQDKEIIVPKDSYFFLGDNSAQSQDGRFWGYAVEDDIVGKAVFIWWPPKRISMVE